MNLIAWRICLAVSSGRSAFGRHCADAVGGMPGEPFHTAAIGRARLAGFAVGQQHIRIQFI